MSLLEGLGLGIIHLLLGPFYYFYNILALSVPGLPGQFYTAFAFLVSFTLPIFILNAVVVLRKFLLMIAVLMWLLFMIAIFAAI